MSCPLDPLPTRHHYQVTTTTTTTTTTSSSSSNKTVDVVVVYSLLVTVPTRICIDTARTGASSSSSVITSDDGKVAASNSAKANLFCKEYADCQSSYEKTKLLMLTLNLKLEAVCCLRVLAQVPITRNPCIDFTSGELERAFFRLPATSSAGSDDVSNIMLKHLLLKGKTCLFATANLSWRSGEAPSPWPVADIRLKTANWQEQLRPSSP